MSSMDKKINIASYLKLFSSLSRAPGAVWTEATKRKAPHKPLLLLAVLDLVHRAVHRRNRRSGGVERAVQPLLAAGGTARTDQQHRRTL